MATLDRYSSDPHQDIAALGRIVDALGLDLSGGLLHHWKALVMVICVALSMILVSISVADNFFHSSTATDQGFHVFGKLAPFVYCLLQKI